MERKFYKDAENWVEKNSQLNKPTMLPRQNRLTLKSDFQKVLKNKKFLHSTFFTGAYLSEGEEKPRVGVIVSNKVSKRAYKRNKIKRVVRAVARKYIDKLPDGLKLVILTKVSATEVESKILSEDMERIFRKII